jgi:hypothetical protein
VLEAPGAARYLWFVTSSFIYETCVAQPPSAVSSLTYSRIDAAKARALSSFFQGRFGANDQIKLSGGSRNASKNRALNFAFC